MKGHRVRFDDYELSDCLDDLDFDRVHGWLANSYWCEGIEKIRLRRGIENSSIIVGAFHAELGQCGFARVVTDFTRFAYLMDVIVDPSHRGNGLGQALVMFFLKHPRMDDIDTWSLATLDAHGLYEKLGFEREPDPDVGW